MSLDQDWKTLDKNKMKKKKKISDVEIELIHQPFNHDKKIQEEAAASQSLKSSSTDQLSHLFFR